MRDFSLNHELLDQHRHGARCRPLDRIIEECARRDIRAISPWRDQVAADKIEQALRATGIRLSGYCRGGFRQLMPPVSRQRWTIIAAH